MAQPEKKPGGWSPRDAWLGLLFLTAGSAMIWFAVLARGNDAPVALWVAYAAFGSLLFLLGANAFARSLWALR